MYDKLTVNDEPFISSNGEIICDEYLPGNNPMNPESSFGWFIYLVIGGAFDDMSEMSTTFLNDLDIMSASHKMLDRFYGVNLNLPRPTIMDDGVNRLLSDDEYRVYLYIRRSRLLTILDLLSVFGHCMGDNNVDDRYNGVTVTKEINSQWQTVDHLHYISPETPSSNIGKNSNDDLNHIVKQGSTEDVYNIPGMANYTGEYIIYVNVPHNDWSHAFLNFLTEFISIKGNVVVREAIQ